MFFEETMLVAHVHELLVTTNIQPQPLYFITAPINSVPPQLKNGRRDQETAIFSGCHQAVKLFHVIRRDIRFDNLGQFSSAFTQISPNATNCVFAFHGLKNQEAIAALKLARLVAFLPEGSCGMTERYGQHHWLQPYHII